jgi:hypothetical protein
MKTCKLRILFDKANRTYAPGESIRGSVEVITSADVTCKALRLTREWRTRGKGNKEKGKTATITLFEGRWRPGETASYTFSIDVPDGPLTYNGRVMNVDWCLRARAHIPWAIDSKAEEIFQVRLDAGRQEYGPQWKPCLDQWPEERHPDQDFWAIVLTAVPFVLGVSLGWEAVAVFFGLFIGLGTAQERIQRMLVQRRLGPAEVTIEPQVVRAGETATLNVSFHPRTSSDLRKVIIKLIGRERAFSGDSEASETCIQVFYEDKIVIDSGRRLIPGEHIDLRCQLQIPAGAPPTFDATHNNVEWIAVVEVEMPWPNWKSEYPIDVVPRHQLANAYA